jgi:hypothetical protein
MSDRLTQNQEELLQGMAKPSIPDRSGGGDSEKDKAKKESVLAALSELQRLREKNQELGGELEAAQAEADTHYGCALEIAKERDDLRERVEGVLSDWLGKQERPMPRGVEEWGPDCVGCGDDEYRIDGFCSIECRDRYQLGLEIRGELNREENDKDPTTNG